MALRSQTVVAVLALAPALFGQELRYNVEHGHGVWWDGAGTLAITERGISYQETGKKKPHHAEWSYEDIQQLYVSPQKLTVLTYEDREWLLGMDKQWEFRLLRGETFNAAYDMLKNRLDQRFVAAFQEPESQPLWDIPVKLLGRIKGSEGILEVAADRVVYRTDAKEQSRTWRLKDIENVSSSGPFQLTVTTYEKGFNFQLKRALSERQYNQLWRSVYAGHQR